MEFKSQILTHFHNRPQQGTKRSLWVFPTKAGDTKSKNSQFHEMQKVEMCDQILRNMNVRGYVGVEEEEQCSQ